jgi:hypothetical protein
LALGERRRARDDFSRWLQYSAVAADIRLISRKATTEMATFRAPFIWALRVRERLDSAPCSRPARELQGARPAVLRDRDCVFHRVALADTRI